MPYVTIAKMAKDAALVERCAACVAQEKPLEDPLAWAGSNAWQLAASPGWAEAWEYAENTGEQFIGASSSVITDGMILAAVQARFSMLEGSLSST